MSSPFGESTPSSRLTPHQRHIVNYYTQDSNNHFELTFRRKLKHTWIHTHRKIVSPGASKFKTDILRPYSPRPLHSITRVDKVLIVDVVFESGKEYVFTLTLSSPTLFFSYFGDLFFLRKKTTRVLKGPLGFFLLETKVTSGKTENKELQGLYEKRQSTCTVW